MVKVLFLVDDDPDDRDIFKEAVAQCRPDTEVAFADNGVDAINLLSKAQSHPDVIFLDYNMPKMNGLEFLRLLKANSSTKNIPTVMYSTSGDREQQKLILLLGADHYMKKTVSFLDLCQQLREIFEMIDNNKDLRTFKKR